MSDEYVQQQKAIVNQMKERFRLGQAEVSIVEMQSDYELDDAISLTSVAFPDQSLAKTIQAQVIQPLRAIEPHQFYYSNQILHITIKNIRKMHKPPRFSEADVIQVNELFTQTVPQFPAFTFRLEGLLLLPTSVAIVGYCNNTLGKLIAALNTGLVAIGLPDDKQYVSDTVFFGNMTICRFTQTPSQEFLAQVQTMEHQFIGEMPITEIQLVTCNSVCSDKNRRSIAKFALASGDF